MRIKCVLCDEYILEGCECWSFDSIEQAERFLEIEEPTDDPA